MISDKTFTMLGAPIFTFNYCEVKDYAIMFYGVLGLDGGIVSVRLFNEYSLEDLLLDSSYLQFEAFDKDGNVVLNGRFLEFPEVRNKIRFKLEDDYALKQEFRSNRVL